MAFLLRTNVIKKKLLTNLCRRLLTIEKSVSTKSLDKATSTIIPYNEIPGPKSLPIIGCLHHFMFGGKYYGDSSDVLVKKLNEEYGDLVKLKIYGRADKLFVYNADDVESIYRSDGPWPIRDDLETILYYRIHVRPDVYSDILGLAVLQGEKWSELRSKLNPVMMNTKLPRQYFEVVNNTANDFVSRVLEIIDENGVTPDDFLTEINKYTLESLGIIALDAKMGIMNESLDETSLPIQLMKSVRLFTELLYELDLQPSIWKLVSTPKFRKLMHCFDTFTNISVKYVNAALERLEKSPKEINGRELSLLEKLLKIDRKLAYVTAVDLMLGGVESVATACAIIMYYLAINMDKQEILRNEIRKHFPNKSDELTFEKIAQIEYLKAVIKEATRLTPVVFANARTLQQDLVISGFHVPKGTNVLLTHKYLSNEEEYFPKARQFLPERWLRSKTGSSNSEHTEVSVPSARKGHKFAYMPFGFGPRTCLGKRISDLEMEVLICHMIRYFKIEWTRDELQFVTKLNTMPIGPLKYKLTVL